MSDSVNEKNGGSLNTVTWKLKLVESLPSVIYPLT
jgi:hypothetical protein